MRLQNDRLFAFSGLMCCGKDFVAKQSRLTVFGFADPIYELCDHLCGTRDKSAPGIRRMMQYIGQVGWNHISDEYPVNPERAIFVETIRRFGRDMTKSFRWVDWTEYGKRNDFWVNILLTKLGLVGDINPRNGQTHLFDAGIDANGYNVAVTNTRFDHELKPLRRAGFEHFHVMCSEETRCERMAKAGYVYQRQTLTDYSEQMAARLNVEMPESRVIWNDFRPMPSSRRFITLDAFAEHSYPEINIQEARRCPIGGTPVAA